MIKIRHAAYGMTLCVLALLFWPRAADPALAIAEANGYKAAKSAIVHRQLAAQMLAGWESAERETDEAIKLGKAALRRTHAQVIAFDGRVALDSTPRIVVGQPVPGDTLVPMPMVRARIQWLMDTATTVIASLEMAIEVERGRASLAVMHLQATIAAQDTVILGLRAELKRKARPWYVRAGRGVEHAGTGAACAVIGYVFGGPFAVVSSITSGVGCAALSGVLR
jgi:hypothetical protein